MKKSLLFVKRCALSAAVLVLAFGSMNITAYATESEAALGTSAINNLPVSGTAQPVDEAVSSVLKQEDSASTGGSGAEAEEEYVEPTQYNTVNANGSTIKTTLEGHYYAKSVPGVAILTPLSELQRQANFIVLEYFFVHTWDLYDSSAPLVMDTLRTIAMSQGAELGSAFQMTINRLFSEKVYTFNNTDVRAAMMIEIPYDFRDPDATYSVAYVKNGGQFEILPDLDNIDSTITVNAHAGSGAYGIMKVK